MTHKHGNELSQADTVSATGELAGKNTPEQSACPSATPGRCAEALARFIDNQTAPILDYGCGEGQSGQSLTQAGFTIIDGIDSSAEMVAKATSRQIYRKVTQIVEDAPLTHDPGTYCAIAATGRITGGAPHCMVHKLMRGLSRGGKLVFSFSDDDLKNTSNEAGLNEWLDCGAAGLLFKEHGIHQPEANMNSTVYVVEKY